jgi:enhancer of mRNA-decapping protein 3
VQLKTDLRKQQGYQAGLYLLPSNRRVETVSALQMLNLENIAANEVGLTQEMMAENAGRAIAQVSLSILTEPAIRIRMESNGGPLSGSSTGNIATIVILAGNNKSGARTLSAARHLRSRVANVMVCLVGVEREQELVEDLRQQMSIYRKLGGKIYKKQELFEQIRKSTLSDAPITVSLIIDALLGLNISFEELRKGDQTSVYELIEWANRNDAFVLAIDVPTGIDPSTGKVSIIDGSRLYIKPRYVIAMGAPKRGLVEALSPVQQDRDGSHGAKAKGALAADGDEWDLFIADIGLGAAVWKKAGTKLRRGIDFDDKWVLEMTYRGEEPDEEEGLRRVSGLLNG